VRVGGRRHEVYRKKRTRPMLVSAPPSPHGTYRVTLPFSPDELTVVDAVVLDLLEAAGIDGPPIDAFELAKGAFGLNPPVR
jgi:hypothetical protein